MPRHVPLYFTVATVAFSLMAAGCSPAHSSATGAIGVWRAAVANGDKPGIGIELSRDGVVNGRIFLIDPNRPGDFAAGSQHAMQIRKVTDTEIRFGVDWKPGIHEEMVLRLKAPLNAAQVEGVLESADGSGAPTRYEFVRTK